MALLEVPARQVRYILEHVYGETDPALYEPSSWAETEAAQRAAGYVWAVRFLPTPFTQFAQLVARQSNADLFQSGGLWHYRWRTRRDPSLTIAALTQVERPTFTRVPVRTALASKLTALWDQNFATGEWRQAKTLTASTASLPPSQRGRSRVTDTPYELQLPYVRAAATADTLARIELAHRDRQRWHVAVGTDWDALPLEKGDAVVIESPVLAATLGTARGTFIVARKGYDLRTDGITVEADQADTAVWTLVGTLAVRARTTGTLPGTLVVKPLFTLLGRLIVTGEIPPAMAWDAVGAVWDTGQWDALIGDALLEDGTSVLLEDGTSLLLEG